MKKVAIIGAGITGLSIGFYLKKAGIPFTIFEKTNRSGGVIKSERKNGFIFERGPNAGVIAGLELADLLIELEKSLPIVYADEKSKKRLILKNNHWYALPDGVFSAIKTPLFSFEDKLKVATEFFRKKENYETETLAETVKRRLGKSILDYAIDPFVSGVYAGDADKLITKYAFPKLYNLEDRYGSFIRGSFQLSKKRSKEYKQKVNKKIFSFENGLQQLPDLLSEIIGKNHFRFNQNNFKIEFIKNNNFKIKNEYFSHVITTVKPKGLSEITNFLPESFLKIMYRMKYAKIVHINLGFQNWNGINIDAFGGLIPQKENKNLLGLLFMSSQFPNRAPKDGALFSVFMGGIKKPQIIDYEDSKIKKILSKEFMDLFEIEEFNPSLFEINRYKSAIAQYGTESKEKLMAINEIEKKYPGFYIQGSIKDGIGISDRISQAYHISQKIKNS